MNPIQLLLLSILFFTAGALVSLLLGAAGSSSRRAAGILSLLGCLVGAISAVLAGVANTPPSLVLFSIPPFGQFLLQMDALSIFLVILITLVGAGVSIYSLSAAPDKASLGFFTNLFIGFMLLVVTSSNLFFFLIFWELMTLASYFLVIWEPENEAAIRTGYIYLLVAHAGAALIMLAFLLLFQQSGSFDFAVLRQTSLSPWAKNLIFLLAFIGFGTKAGMVPLHFWTPATYAAAPSHASALMSSVMKKTAIYGILRICVDLLGTPILWWGITILAFGALSTVIGAFYALTERDLKRLLAYSSVENVGIILMGVGLGVSGLAQQQPPLALLGFLAALYHSLNHAFFKGLLFLGAGSAIDQSQTSDLNQMGGLARRMPRTALAFLVAALAVAAIPPLNGFVSEWFLYQAFFTASQSAFFMMRAFAPICAILMALAGAIAIMIYVKAYGSAFSGPARSPAAASAHEAPRSALFGLGYLAVGCLALGIGAPWIAPWIANTAASFAGISPVTVASSGILYAATMNQGVLSPPLVAILLVGLLTVPWLIVALYGGRRAGRRSGVEPWSCGYGYSANMSISASSFDQPVKLTFSPIYWLRSLTDKPFQRIAALSRSALNSIRSAEPVIEMAITRPTARLVETAGQWIQGLQMGDLRVYCLYIIITLAVLLIVIFGGGGL